MVKPSTKIYMGLTGVALIILGIVCLCNPGSTLLSISWLIGLFTLISGVFNFCTWIRSKSYLPQSGMVLLSSILEIILGITFMNHNLLLATMLPLLFGIWLLIEGISLAIRSFDYKAVGFRAWWLLTLLGALAAVGGYFAIVNPFRVGGTALSIIIGAGIIILGIIDILALCGLKKFEKKHFAWLDDYVDYQ